ncbi:uncharacterized protein MELLADRAFT_103447 [Melampsora larici-populina 98AG31]|uniref:Uncharacterized protein n=1 Tax=Melampsora larici-populina (strain 98AG31 / pathotype 3-4-7) TaxID=747676 RepID=F4RBH5_MELLP|nr:uncharacterized protein MELLADRAFT_103447 [Melampsora larici-populina 98AG31]EGG10360.1 hypothetical protein MELLADRAFT_103447 [Melampsora larici-populina 98AG31]
MDPHHMDSDYGGSFEPIDGRTLRMAHKEVRMMQKEQSFLAEDYREAFATKSSRRAHSEVKEGNFIAPKGKKVQHSASSKADTFMHKVISITGDVGRANRAASFAQHKQNTRVNMLYECELDVAKQSAQSLAQNRKSELELQRSRRLFDSTQATT